MQTSSLKISLVMVPEPRLGAPLVMIPRLAVVARLTPLHFVLVSIMTPSPPVVVRMLVLIPLEWTTTVLIDPIVLTSLVPESHPLRTTSARFVRLTLVCTSLMVVVVKGPLAVTSIPTTVPPARRPEPPYIPYERSVIAKRYRTAVRGVEVINTLAISDVHYFSVGGAGEESRS